MNSAQNLRDEGLWREIKQILATNYPNLLSARDIRHKSSIDRKNDINRVLTHKLRQNVVCKDQSSPPRWQLRSPQSSNSSNIQYPQQYQQPISSPSQASNPYNYNMHPHNQQMSNNMPSYSSHAPNVNNSIGSHGVFTFNQQHYPQVKAQNNIYPQQMKQHHHYNGNNYNNEPNYRQSPQIMSPSVSDAKSILIQQLIDMGYRRDIVERACKIHEVIIILFIVVKYYCLTSYNITNSLNMLRVTETVMTWEQLQTSFPHFKILTKQNKLQHQNSNKIWADLITKSIIKSTIFQEEDEDEDEVEEDIEEEEGL